MKLKTLIKKLEAHYPKNLSESWDNVGLLLGDSESEIKKVQLSLDVTESVVDRAVENGVDLIISHHPMIFSGLKRITNTTLVGKKILKLIKNNISVYSMHTNLDSALGGLNEYVAKKLGAEDSKIIDETYFDTYKLSVYVPSTHFEALMEKINGSGLLEFNGYKNVSYSSKCEEVIDEKVGKSTKIELIGEKNTLYAILEQARKVHPYEEPAYEIIKIENKYSKGGIGRYFSLEKTYSLDEYIGLIKEKLGIENLRVVCGAGNKIKKVAVVNGSGASFLDKVSRLNVDLFITGDVKYHEALDAREAGLALIDIGHYESEVFFSDLVVDKLADEVEIEIFNDNPVFDYR